MDYQGFHEFKRRNLSRGYACYIHLYVLPFDILLQLIEKQDPEKLPDFDDLVDQYDQPVIMRYTLHTYRSRKCFICFLHVSKEVHSYVETTCR